MDASKLAEGGGGYDSRELAFSRGQPVRIGYIYAFILMMFVSGCFDNTEDQGPGVAVPRTAQP
jgi:hypothetical protein